MTGAGTGMSRSAPRRDAEPTPRRTYDNTLRQQQAEATRERVVAAGAELLRNSPVRDWRDLTIRAVAERADVSERTIYRHFEHERGLRDAVMHRLEQEAGIDLASMRLDSIGEVAAQTLQQVSEFPLDARPPLDPTLSDANKRQRTALLQAISEHTEGWSEPDREAAAAVFDVLWSVAAYERLIVSWNFDHKEAVSCLTWAIDLVEAAIRRGEAPTAARR